MLQKRLYNALSYWWVFPQWKDWHMTMGEIWNLTYLRQGQGRLIVLNNVLSTCEFLKLPNQQRTLY